MSEVAIRSPPLCGKPRSSPSIFALVLFSSLHGLPFIALLCLHASTIGCSPTPLFHHAPPRYRRIFVLSDSFFARVPCGSWLWRDKYCQRTLLTRSAVAKKWPKKVVCPFRGPTWSFLAAVSRPLLAPKSLHCAASGQCPHCPSSIFHGPHFRLDPVCAHAFSFNIST